MRNEINSITMENCSAKANGTGAFPANYPLQCSVGLLLDIRFCCVICYINKGRVYFLNDFVERVENRLYGSAPLGRDNFKGDKRFSCFVVVFYYFHKKKRKFTGKLQIL